MTGEQLHSTDSESQVLAKTVTVEEFAAVEVEAPVRDSTHVDCWTLATLYQGTASEAEAGGKETALRVFGLLEPT